ncbi:MAG: VOC family protein [Moraxellaceae bacterium]
MNGNRKENIKAVPDGYDSVTPYLVVRGAAKAIVFYEKAFGAVERLRLPAPGGGIGHAELKIGNSIIMLADEFPDMGARGPRTIGGSPVSLLIYVENVDDVFTGALAAGARELRPLENKFYGDRAGQLEDPFGHIWTLASHIEDVTAEQLQQRMEETFSSIVPT